MRNIILASVAALGLLSGVARADSPTAAWSKIGPWQIMVDRTTGNSCFMMGAYPTTGTVLRVGFNNRGNYAYIILGNAAWRTLEVGKVYQIGGQFDGGELGTWNATAVQMGDQTYLQVNFTSPSPYEVMQAFGQHLNLKLVYHGAVLDNLKLNGTAAAAAETANCNRQFQATKAPDPFQATKPASEKRDPFDGDF